MPRTGGIASTWVRQLLWVVVAGLLATACSSDGKSPTTSTPTSAALDEVVDIGGGRTLYVRCTGEGSPTVILEGGDGDDSASYRFAESNLADETRTCVYDRANLGRSGAAPGPRGLADLVGDLERLLEVADIPGPYVLVGTSGGGRRIPGAATSPGAAPGPAVTRGTGG